MNGAATCTKSTGRSAWKGLAVAICLLVVGACGGGSGGGGGSVVKPVDIIVSGNVTYDRVPHNSVTGGLDYQSMTAVAVRGAVVEAIDAAGRTLVSGITSATGRYELSVPANTSMSIRVKAQILRTGKPAWDFQVQDNTRDLLYAMESASFSSGTQNLSRDLRADSGWDGSTYATARVAAPFAILDTVYDQLQPVLMADPDIEFPPLVLNWSPLNRASQEFDPSIGEIVTTAYFGLQPPAIYVLGDENVDTDEYDAHVLAHEWGHYLEDQLARSDSIGGRHSIFGFFDPRLALSEGWSNAWSAISLADPLYKDTAGFQQSSAFVFDIESNSTFNPGWYNESSVHSVIYDIYDTASDGVDSVTLGFPPIYAALTGAHANSVSLTTIYSLLSNLKVEETNSADGINALLDGQDIVGAGMDIWATLETNDAGTSDVLPVYSDIQPGGSPVTICSLSSFGTYNGLSTRRFVRRGVGSEGMYDFRLTGPPGSDPDAVIYSTGPVAIYQSEENGVESFSTLLGVGEHVLEVYEYANLDEPGAGRVCFELTMSQGS